MTASNNNAGSGTPDPQPAFHAAASAMAGLSWAALNARHQAERDAWLAQAILDLGSYYKQIGPLGDAFSREVALTGCGEFVDPELPARAAFHAHHLTQGFSNQIFYSPSALQTTQGLFSSRTHEAVHALQFSRCAATHATPYNGASKIILCPRDGVLLDELKERDAFSKQWLLQRLYDEPGYNTQSPDQWKQDLRQHAETVLESMNLRRGYNFRDYYRDREIESYEDCMVSRHQQEQGLTYVRLDAADLWMLGGALGLNTFGDTLGEASRWRGLHLLTPGQEGRIAVLNQQLGIMQESTLPTLRQALMAQGTSRPLFMRQAICGVGVKTPVAGADLGPKLP